MEGGLEDMEIEKKRKVRISAGGLQAILILKVLLNIFSYGLFSFQYISHIVLRWTITPILLFALIPLNIAIVCDRNYGVYLILLIAQSIFYALVAIGYVMRDKNIKIKLLFIPLYFIFMNTNVLLGIPYLIKNKGKGAWEKSKRK